MAHHDDCWLDISMQEPLLVGVIQRTGDPGDDASNVLDRHPSLISVGQEADRIESVDAVHRNPQLPVLLPPVVRLIRWLLIGAGILLVLAEAAVLLRGVSELGFTGGKVLDVTKVQAGVLQTLSDPASGYGANTVTDVSCNHGRNPSAERGATFTCDVTVNGATRHVTVVVSDDHGTYEIDRPR
jgi:hypothetical protein